MVRAVTREYYIAAVIKEWNYAPSGQNQIKGMALQDDRYAKGELCRKQLPLFNEFPLTVNQTIPYSLLLLFCSFVFWHLFSSTVMRSLLLKTVIHRLI